MLRSKSDEVVIEMKDVMGGFGLVQNQINQHTSATPAAWRDMMKMRILKNKGKKKINCVKTSILH